MTTSPLFKRVPVEPTPEIIEAMAKARCLDYDKDYFDEEERAEVREWVSKEWDAALAASPEPPAEEVETVDKAQAWDALIKRSAEVETLRKRVKELEEALAPFSLIGGPLNAVTEGVFPDDASARFLNLGELKAKHFRGAATALDRARAKGNG